MEANLSSMVVAAEALKSQLNTLSISSVQMLFKTQFRSTDTTSLIYIFYDHVSASPERDFKMNNYLGFSFL